MAHLYVALFEWVQAYGLFGATLFMLVESAGAPFPTELGFIASQGLIASGAAGYWEVFTWLTVGHLVGSAVSFYLGRATENAVSRRLAQKPGVMHARAQLQKWYARYAGPTIVFGRLIGQVRPFASFVAGLSQVPAVTFWVWTVIGSLLYTAIAMWMTAVGWKFWLAHAQWRVPLIVGMLVIFYGLPAYKIAEHFLKRWRRARQQPAPDETP